jgi:peptidoglycan hydrolase-like protein with peptidoglycan-binding domain
MADLPETGALVSNPDRVQLHDAGWVDLSSGAQITRLPLWDDEHQLFARLGWQDADNWCKRQGGRGDVELALGAIFGWWRGDGQMWQPLRGGKPSMFHASEPHYTDYATTVHVVLDSRGFYRLPTPAEYSELHAKALHIEPFPLPTRTMCAERSIPYSWQDPAYRAYQYRSMRSHRWCTLHDEEVLRRLALAAWDRGSPEPVANAGKHWCLAGEIDRDTEPAPESGPVVVSISHPEPDSWRPVLRRGMRGDDVAAWQAVIGVEVDGIFGPDTEAATKRWQAERELVADGLVGPRTRAAIGTEPVPHPEPKPEPVPPAGPGAGILPEPMQFFEAVHYGREVREAVDWFIVHSTENDPLDAAGMIRPWVALGVARWGAGKDWRGRPAKAPLASWHYVIGGDEKPVNGVIQCVREKHAAYTAGVRIVNQHSVNIEIVGQAMRTDWSSPIMRPTLQRAAALAARSCRRWSIPVREVLLQDLREARDLLRAGASQLPKRCRGIISHGDVTEAWEVRGGHQDPGGPGDRRWPWDLFLGLVRSSAGLDSVESIEIG